MNKKIKIPDNRSVTIDEDYTLEFWAKEFNVSKKKLKQAVLAAGTAVQDVKRELKK